MQVVSEIPQAVELKCPVFDDDGILYVLSQGTGEIFKVGIDENVCWGNTYGAPGGIALDGTGNMYVADTAHAAIINVEAESKESQLRKIVSDYENRGLRGPSSLTFDSNGTLFFTDSGALGETTLQQPKGSVFAITRENESGQMLKPIVTDCLAHPCGIAVSSSDGCLFVAEMLKNRVLRFTQRPAGVYHCSVYHQFSGRLGPSAIACGDDGIIYVARYDFQKPAEYENSELVNNAIISVIHPVKGHIHDISVPGGPEITGICLSPNGRDLYITEASSSCIYKCAI